MRPVLLAVAVAVLAGPAVVIAQTGGGGAAQYPLPTPTPTPTPAPSPAANASPPAPRLGRAAVLERVSGRVSYRIPGTPRFVRLREPAQVAMGTSVDARNGRVRVMVARNRSGGRWSSVFFRGRFLLEQETTGRRVTTLTLTGGSFKKRCAKAGASRLPADARKPVRRLWGDGKGRFRTSGRYSAATVRGTRWLVEDRCDGTVTRVTRGEVVVEDFTVQPPPEGPPAGAPAPVIEGGGGQDGSGQAPSAAPPSQDAPRARPRQVRLRRGGSYVARPG